MSLELNRIFCSDNEIGSFVLVFNLPRPPHESDDSQRQIEFLVDIDNHCQQHSEINASGVEKIMSAFRKIGLRFPPLDSVSAIRVPISVGSDHVQMACQCQQKHVDISFGAHDETLIIVPRKSFAAVDAVNQNHEIVGHIRSEIFTRKQWDDLIEEFGDGPHNYFESSSADRSDDCDLISKYHEQFKVIGEQVRIARSRFGQSAAASVTKVGQSKTGKAAKKQAKRNKMNKTESVNSNRNGPNSIESHVLYTNHNTALERGVNMMTCLTIQDGPKHGLYQSVYGADPFGGLVRSWQIQHSKTDPVKQNVLPRYHQIPVNMQEGVSLKNGPSSAPGHAHFIRDCPGFRQEERAFNTDHRNTMQQLEMIDGVTGIQLLVDDDLSVLFSVSVHDAGHPVPESVQHIGKTLVYDTKWTQHTNNTLITALMLRQYRSDTSMDTGTKAKSSAAQPEHKIERSYVLVLPEAAALSAVCLLNENIIFIPRKLNAFREKSALTIGVVPYECVIEGNQVCGRKNGMERRMVVWLKRPAYNTLVNLVPVSERVTAPTFDWTFTTDTDYYKDGLLVGNAHAWVSWQQGRVLVGMMQHKQTAQLAVALITFETVDQGMCQPDTLQISKFKMVPLPQSLSMLYSEKGYPVRLVGHFRRYLIFRTGAAKLAAVQMLYRRMDMVPKDLAKAQWHLMDFQQEIRHFGFIYFQESDVEMPHVSRIHILAGGLVVFRLRFTPDDTYVKKQVELLVRMPISQIIHKEDPNN